MVKRSSRFSPRACLQSDSQPQREEAQVRRGARRYKTFYGRDTRRWTSGSPRRQTQSQFYPKESRQFGRSSGCLNTGRPAHTKLLLLLLRSQLLEPHCAHQGEATIDLPFLHFLSLLMWYRYIRGTHVVWNHVGLVSKLHHAGMSCTGTGHGRMPPWLPLNTDVA
jgi:hypothetical protein